ncbi:hypothetical protein [Streptomyces sp. SAI-090]|jgi:hypothetical protein|uniref:Rv1733c family protein n=1 Tax=Streptomyces sp. SAI-090 TaxID=2940545 RepID=UPI00247636B2|nr:hypothetical protein [Streptomyces sp. SAI-090]MDH6522250.1 hypothetical protein [Streptomyces sp. SAI-090]
MRDGKRATNTNTGAKKATKRLWRWRSNPLRRRDDVVEAWIVLAVWTVIALAGTLAGVVTAHAADAVFAQQRAERSPVRAILLTDAPRTISAIGGAGGDQTRAAVRWTAPDGSVRTGRTLVDAGQNAGSRTTVWTSAQGDLSTRPPSPAGAAVEAGGLGASAALALAGVVYGTGRAARGWLERRRIDQWGTEWALVGPQWGHKTG